MFNRFLLASYKLNLDLDLIWLKIDFLFAIDYIDIQASQRKLRDVKKVTEE